MYVDGLLAENHGAGALHLDPAALGEPTGGNDVLYTEQPYWPNPDPRRRRTRTSPTSTSGSAR